MFIISGSFSKLFFLTVLEFSWKAGRRHGRERGPGEGIAPQIKYFIGLSLMFSLSFFWLAKRAPPGPKKLFEGGRWRH